jgi:catechol 2,3-dioxygenase-like lactoylglutathione lyase family enzyme
MAIVTPDPVKSRKLFIEALGLPLKRHDGDEYYFSENIGGSKHFGVWPLSQAAEACFGSRDWPEDRQIPQACVEFEVEDLDSVSAAAQELRAKGYAMLHDARTEPWGQTVTRLLTPEGVIVGISYAPWMHVA